MAEAHPWLGVGFGNFAAAYPEFRLLLWENALGHAHNTYLNLLAETGILGLLTYLGMWATIVIGTVRIARGSPRPAAQASWLALILVPTTAAAALAVGILGAWAHLAAHHLFDKLYVANMHMVFGAYLGFLIAARETG
jgi:O-antigen ligase